jgi:aminoglycoside phosphotransferase (APT) family kinase protein
VVEYADGIRYGFRLPYHSRKSKIHDLLWSDELEHWEAFVQANVSSVPQIVGSDLSTDNAIGFPFVVYEWVQGKPLLWDDHEPRDRVQRDEIIKNLARLTIETACRLQKPGKPQIHVPSRID